MSIRYPLLALAALFIVQPVFADDVMNTNSPACATIAKSCSDAGYTRDGTTGKQFWFDCMKPLVLGKAVSGITVDAKTVKTCRMDKIKELKQELEDLKKAK